MIEWYRANADYSALMDDCEGLLRCALAEFTSRNPIAPGFDGELRVDAPFARITCREAFAQFAAVDVVGASNDELRAAARRHGIDVGDDWDRDSLFTVLYAEAVEPNLGFPQPTFITEFPADQAALSRRCANDPSVAERFELYVGGRWERDPGRGGIELANAFSELIDPIEQRARFEADLAKRRSAGVAQYPMPDAMLAGIQTMPPTAGIALGFERLAVWIAEAVFGWEIGVADLLLGEPARPK
jgi:lysyl-tRNA synthetase class 2